MVVPLPATHRLEYLDLPTRIDSAEDSSVNHAFAHVAQLVVEKLQHAYSRRVDDSNYTPTISIRSFNAKHYSEAIAPEYRHPISIEPLSPRELEVLQLIVEGNKNPIIAQKLYIAEGTVKTHVRNILRKLCATDRTQAAIRALRCGLVH